jgi:hypothetical protein
MRRRRLSIKLRRRQGYLLQTNFRRKAKNNRLFGRYILGARHLCFLRRVFDEFFYFVPLLIHVRNS